MTSEPRLAECSTCKRINTAPEGCLLEWNEVPSYCGGCHRIVTHRLLRRARVPASQPLPADMPTMQAPRIE
jgi:hypothetical protein